SNGRRSASARTTDNLDLDIWRRLQRVDEYAARISTAPLRQNQTTSPPNDSVSLVSHDGKRNFSVHIATRLMDEMNPQERGFGVFRLVRLRVAGKQAALKLRAIINHMLHRARALATVDTRRLSGHDKAGKPVACFDSDCHAAIGRDRCSEVAC